MHWLQSAIDTTADSLYVSQYPICVLFIIAWITGGFAGTTKKFAVGCAYQIGFAVVSDGRRALAERHPRFLTNPFVCTFRAIWSVPRRSELTMRPTTMYVDSQSRSSYRKTIGY